MKNKTILIYFEDEQPMLNAVKLFRKQGRNLKDVLSPFPIHGLDEAMGLKESKIPIAGFIFGGLGTITAFVFLSWVMAIDWPMNFGGKPFFAVPSFIPVIFEVTVLFSALGMIGYFLFKSNLHPHSNNKIYDPKITDNAFVISMEVNNDFSNQDSLNLWQEYKNQGVTDVKLLDN